MDIKERIRRAGPTTRTVRVWLGADLDLVDEYETALAALEAAKQPGDSLAGNGSPAELEKRVDGLRKRLDGFAADFRMRGLDDLNWSRLVDAHPPRPDDKLDADMGYNTETLPPAAVRLGTVTVDGEELDDGDWLALIGEHGSLGVLTSNQLEQLFKMVFRLTRHAVDVPFSPAASKPTQSSGRG